MDKKLFAILVFSIFTTITGVGIVVPLLPVYARNLGASGFYIGMIFGVFSLSRTVLLPVFGRWSDSRGRKPFIVLGLLAYALVSVAFIFSSSVTELIVIRFFQGIASAMIMPVVQAYVADITPEGQEGFIMGLFSMSMFLGLSMGPVAGGMLSDRFDLNAPFICMGVLSLAGFAMCQFLLPDVGQEIGRRPGREPKLWRRILNDRVIVGLCLFRLTYTAGIGVIWGFLPILADALLGLSSWRIGVLVTLAVLVSGLVQAPMGWLADRWPRRRMIAAGGMLAAVAIYSYTLCDSFTEMLLSSLAFGLGGGIAMPALMAVSVLKGQQKEAMGSVMSLLTMAHSLGMMIGALLAGLMMDLFHLGGAFELGAVLIAAGSAAFYASTRHAVVDRPVKKEP